MGWGRLKDSPKRPELDREYYKRRVSEVGRKAFEVAAGAGFYVFVDWVLHWTLIWVGIARTTQPGALVHGTLNWGVGITYLVMVFRYLIPDANEQAAEVVDEIHKRWGSKH